MRSSSCFASKAFEIQKSKTDDIGPGRYQKWQALRWRLFKILTENMFGEFKTGRDSPDLFYKALGEAP
jgi:hypothetical protein